MTDDIRARCIGCHRTERWQDGACIAVVAEGGLRRAASREIEQLRTLLLAQAGYIGQVLGPCAACGQFLVADGVGPAGLSEAHPFEVEGGQLVVGPGANLLGPDGPVSQAEAERLVAAAFPGAPFDEEPAFSGPLHGLFLLFLVAPISVWIFSVTFVVFFLSNFSLP